MYDAESGSILGEESVIPHKRLEEAVVPHGRLIRDLPNGVNVFNLSRCVEPLVLGPWRGGKHRSTSRTQDAAVGQGVYHRVVAVDCCLATGRGVTGKYGGLSGIGTHGCWNGL